jgi:hypothetical protein
VKSDQCGPVASYPEQQVAVRGLDRVRHPAGLPGDLYLAHREPMRGRPGADFLEHPLNAPGRVDNQPQLTQRLL